MENAEPTRAKNPAGVMKHWSRLPRVVDIKNSAVYPALTAWSRMFDLEVLQRSLSPI